MDIYILGIPPKIAACSNLCDAQQFVSIIRNSDPKIMRSRCLQFRIGMAASECGSKFWKIEYTLHSSPLENLIGFYVCIGPTWWSLLTRLSTNTRNAGADSESCTILYNNIRSVLNRRLSDRKALLRRLVHDANQQLHFAAPFWTTAWWVTILLTPTICADVTWLGWPALDPMWFPQAMATILVKSVTA